MNNSFPRLIDGMCATLRSEVLTRLDDEFARGQVFGVINLLNTFKVRADWAQDFLLQQLAAQRHALDAVTALAGDGAGAVGFPRPAAAVPPVTTPIAALMALRDSQNAELQALLSWLDAARAALGEDSASRMEVALRGAMREELSIELKNSPRPLFAEMSSGQEDR